MCRVHDRRALRQAAGSGEELDRTAAVLGEALLDLFWLLVGMDVEREPFGHRVAANFLEPVRRARANGVGGDADVDPARRQHLDLFEELGDRGLPEAGRPPRAYATWRRTNTMPAADAASAAARASAGPR